MKHAKHAPLSKFDVVRIQNGKFRATGVVNRIDGNMVNVFVTKNKDAFGTWFHPCDLKRIGRVAKARGES